MKLKHIACSIGLATIGLATSSCNDFLEREPISSITPSEYFNTSDQLGAYAINYYTSIFTSYSGNYNAGPINEDGDTDNLVSGEANTNYYAKGLWLVPANKNLSFTTIRAMNYFLEIVLPKYEAGEISGTDADIRQYIGEIYFMRAFAYYKMLIKFGDFPIVTTVPADESSELTELSKRSPRNEVARFILEDLDKSISMLENKRDNKVRINYEAAQLLKARVALFEATFEKYHQGTPRVPGESGWPGANMSYNQGKTFDISGEISFFLTEAMNASAEIAESHTLTSNSGITNPQKIGQIYNWNNYFEMFSMPDPGSVDEVLLWRQYSSSQSVTHGYLPYIQEGGNNGMTKSYVDAFLMKNGLPIYASNSGYKGDETIDLQKTNRDDRLQLFVFGENDLLANQDSFRYFGAPGIVKQTEHRDRTGFRQRKHFVYDQSQISNGINGTNGYVVFRAAEAYLIYLEASYIKNGTLDNKADKYWRALRERAGIEPDYTKTIAATNLSEEPDWAKYSGSTLVDPTLYNIRRERRCEFIGEGMRRDDLLRWRSFDALLDGNMGAYIPEGINLWTSIYTDDSYKEKDSNGNYTGKSALIEQATGLSSANVSSRTDSKYLRPYRIIKENNQVWDGYQWAKAHYLYPISIEDMTLTSSDGTVGNSVIYQNPYWPTTASSSALE